MGGITSPFQFVSYKIDNISLTIKSNLAVLGNAYNGSEHWQFQYGLTQPLHINGPDIYLAGVNIRTILGKPEDPDVNLFTNITGIFKLVIKKEIDNDLEQFIKVQMPALLSPYLRSIITNIMSMAGFGQVIPPLVNFREMAKDLLADKPILEEGITNVEVDKGST